MIAAARKRHVDRGKQVGSTVHPKWHAEAQGGPRDLRVLRAEPALLGDKGRQPVGFELLTGGLGQQLLEPAPYHESEQVRQRLRERLMPARQIRLLGQDKPIEAVARKRQQIREITDGRKQTASAELDRNTTLIAREIELYRLGRVREVEDAQDRRALMLAQIGQDLPVTGIEELERAAAEGALGLSNRDGALRPAQQTGGGARLRLHGHRLKSIDRIHDRRQIQ